MARKERGFCGFCQVYESLHIHSPEVRAALNAEGTGYRHAKELGGIIFDLQRQLQQAQAERKAAIGRVEAAEALKPYARHPHYCANFLFQRECDCGLAKILAALTPAEAQEEGDGG